MKMFLRVTLASWLTMGAVCQVSAATYYVDRANKAHSANGSTPETAFRSIQAACEVVQPGDTVVVRSGVYHEHVELTRAGTPESPITFQVDRREKGRVIISGAEPRVRAGKAEWRLEDEGAQLYSTALTFTPGRVLYDEIDLYRYDSLEGLRRFESIRSEVATPAPRHGWYFDTKGHKLYVRLHPGGRYGLQDPAKHVMKVGPPGAGGEYGNEIEKRTDYNFAVATSEPAHVILDGFTFETPGFAGVWVHRGSVTVRNCWFRGCRAAVSGWATKDSRRPTADVRIEYCDFSEEPTTADAEEVIAAAEQLPEEVRAKLPAFFWWHRKSPSVTSYQGGAFNDLGDRPKVLHCRFSEMLDGVAVFGIDHSDGAEVAFNRFERILDNAVECENHAQNMRVHHNDIRDVFEPFSYQPQSGEPWPGGVWFYRNVITSTPGWTELWRKPVLRWVPGCFKIKAPKGFTRPTLDGLVVFNNTAIFPSGDVFSLNKAATASGNFTFFNNIVLARAIDRRWARSGLPEWALSNNLVAPAEGGEDGPGALFAGSDGIQAEGLGALGIVAPNAEDFALSAVSPALGRGRVDARYSDAGTDIGALRQGEQWKTPDVGPRIDAVPEIVSYPAWKPAPGRTGRTIVRETFESHAGTLETTGPLTWRRLSPSNGGSPMTLSLTEPGAGLGSGRAVLIDNEGEEREPRSLKTILATFPRQSLERVGEHVEVSLDLLLRKIANQSADNLFRFGLYDSRGTTVVQDLRSSPAADDAGYVVAMPFGESLARSYFAKEAGIEGGMLQEDLVPIGVDLSGVFALGRRAKTLTLRLIAERVSSGIVLAFVITDARGRVVMEGKEMDASAPITSFDELIFSTVGMEADYLLDNLTVKKGSR